MSFLKDLNSAQLDAVKAVDGPVMIVAGAGSGKTRVLTYRLAHLVDLGVRPESILALTFTNKAADEMKSRIVSLVGERSRAVWMGTFHSIFARLLRFEIEPLGYSRHYSIYDSDDSLGVVRQVMNDLQISQQQYNPSAIRSRISSAKNQMLTPKTYASGVYDPMAERTARVFEEYERVLKKNNALDFDDLILKPLELFGKLPEVLKRYQFRFKYLMVDEYQDTNRVQYNLIRALGDGHRNVCVVGDDAQSIYAFRGADIRNILDFEQDYPDCKVFRLEQNYRSTQTILSAADGVIRNNENRIPKKLWTENEEGEPITLHTCGDDREEGARVAQAVQEEIHRKKLDLKDFAVLYRTNAQSRSLEDALRRSGVPYHIVGGVAFYRRKEIKDLLAYLKLVANPRDGESLLRAINTPPRGIGETTIRRISELAARHEGSLFETLSDPRLASLVGERAMKAIRPFQAMVGKYIGLKPDMSAGELTRSLVDEIGILRTLKEEGTAEALARRENVLELVSAVTEFTDNKPGATLDDFLEEVSLVSDVDTAEFGRNAVTLMTLHAAKGLEFPVVFVTGLEEGLFPLAQSLESKQDLEEERRLFYVGMTRAMRKLYISYASTRYRFGELSYSVRSRFLDEIDPSLVSEAQPLHRHHQPYRRPGTAASAAPAPAPAARRRPVKDPYFSDSTPDYESESQESGEARVGQKVVHEAFGPGRIVMIDGTGAAARAVVDFESVGRKHLMLKFAHLRTGS
jgi:DNA helicase-2/ATP-dependent DNA helicase PcrA